MQMGVSLAFHAERKNVCLKMITTYVSLATNSYVQVVPHIIDRRLTVIIVKNATNYKGVALCQNLKVFAHFARLK